MKLIKKKIDELYINSIKPNIILGEIGNSFINKIRLLQNEYILLEDEEDITKFDIIEILYNKFGFLDYVQMRDCYKYLSLTYNDQDYITKDRICTVCAIDINTIIGNYMLKGMSLQEAQGLYLYNKATDVKLSAICFSTRSSSTNLLITILKHLGQQQAEMFLDSVRNFINDLKESAVLGTNYGNSRDGIMDYIEGTNSYIGSGLENYTITDLTLCRKEIKDILYFGFTS